MFRPTIKQLGYLHAIHDRRSFKDAAEECAITQGTMSAAIRDLEDLLGQQLVIRGRKEAILTPFGLEVVAKASDILDQADEIVMRAKLLKEPLSGPLRIGIIPTIAPYLLPDMLPQLGANHPHLEPQLFEDLTDHLLVSLQRSQIDLAILAFPYETPDMEQLILYEEPFYAAIAEGIDREKESIRMQDLEPEKLLLLEDGHCLRDHALSACDLQAPRTRKTFSATSLPTLIQMVRAGFGMTLLPEMACRPNTLPQGIKLLPFRGKRPPTRQIGLCWRKNDPRRNDYETLAKSLL